MYSLQRMYISVNLQPAWSVPPFFQPTHPPPAPQYPTHPPPAPNILSNNITTDYEALSVAKPLLACQEYKDFKCVVIITIVVIGVYHR